MTFFRRSGGQILLLLFSVLGIGIAIYLTAEHYQKIPLVCSTSGIIDCARVLSSHYSVVPSTTIPITIPGLLWCIVSAALAFSAWRIWPQKRIVLTAELLWMALGLLSVFYLVYVEIVLLSTICVWCTAFHIILLVMFLIAVLQWQSASSQDGDEADETWEADKDVEIEEATPSITPTRNN